MKQLLILSLLLFGAAAATIVPISMIGNTYVPDTAIIAVGDSVVWTNNEAFTHTSTSGANGMPDGLWNSGFLSQGQSYGRRFTQNGDFPYFCTIHFPITGMAGLIRVGTGGVGEGPASPGGNNPSIAAYPNPFRSSTTIRYLSARKLAGTVAIANAAGRVVRELGIDSRASGATWDGLNRLGAPVPDGVYFIRVRSPSHAALARVEIVR
jgi:plastocyanin